MGIEELATIIRDDLAIPDTRSALSSVGANVIDFAVDRPAMFELIARHDLLEGAGGNLRKMTGGWLKLLTPRLRDIRTDADERHSLASWAGIQGLGAMLGRRNTDVIAARTITPKPTLAVLIDGIVESG